MFKRKSVKPEIKSLEEIKLILKQNKNAGGVGYVIAPELMKIAKDLGLVGYGEALIKWAGSGVFDQKVYAKGEPIPGGVDSPSLMVSWEGPALRYGGQGIALGIKETLRQIDLAL
jgi:hypothetical protein